MTTSNWMSRTPDIDSLNICELTLPGAHNAGSDWRATYPIFGPPRHWLACQHDSFHAQLNHGARALDIRLRYDAKGEGPRKFVLHHNGHTNSRTLENLVNDVNSFLKKNPDEFIVLDFHSLDGNDFDYQNFNNAITTLLGDRLVPRVNQSLTLQELKRISTTQRVFAAARSHSKLDYKVFHDKISHKWSGNGITNPDELRQFIEHVMKNPPGTWNSWSLSATSYTALGGPVDIHNELNEWFDLDKSDWALKCNIINVDFIEESDLVEFCRVANVLKAKQRTA
ncbi:phosphatidylinositol-specific phospholipase C domain-containing protein [Pseudomonas gozinkensis]|uniref:phosphatidylinositol-specific phospholipase C domain-containing protein n=1 Tax=Pseudomonas gozinkensis TaxID=2774461 RepID=UPI001787C9AF|nr:phosphatidylinositol-specific phospholipase C domain-containing protein [Pseudomonas gozinkensis]